MNYIPCIYTDYKSTFNSHFIINVPFRVLVQKHIFLTHLFFASIAHITISISQIKLYIRPPFIRFVMVSLKQILMMN